MKKDITVEKINKKGKFKELDKSYFQNTGYRIWKRENPEEGTECYKVEFKKKGFWEKDKYAYYLLKEKSDEI